MSEIGVLQLQIRDNSEQAGKGLDNLAGALGRVSQAISNGFDLSPVAEQVKKLLTTINGIKDSNVTVKGITSLFNSLSKFGKLQSFTIDSDPIKNLTESVGDGTGLAKAANALRTLRTTLEGSWDTTSATTGMRNIAAAANIFAENNTAEKLREVSSALKEYARVNRNINEAGTEGTAAGMAMNVQSLIDNVNRRLAENKITTEIGNIEINTDGFAEAERSIREVVTSATDLNELLGNTEEHISGVGEASETFREFAESVEKGLDVHAIANDIGTPLDYLRDRFKNCEIAAQSFRDTLSSAPLGFKESSIEKGNVIAGTEEARKFIDEYIQKGEQLSEVLGKANDLMGSLFRMGQYSGMGEDFGWYDKQPLLLGSGESEKEAYDRYQNYMNETLDNIWNAYKQGAIPAEGSISDAADSVAEQYKSTALIVVESVDKIIDANERLIAANDALETSNSRIEKANAIRKEQENEFYTNNSKSLEETNAMADRLTQLDLLKAQLREAEQKYNDYVNSLGAGAAKTIKAGLAVSDLRDKIWQFKEEIKNAREEKLEDTIEREPISLDQTNAMVGNLTQLQLMEAQLQEAEQKYNDFVNSLGAGAAKTIKAGLAVADMREKIAQYKAELETPSNSQLLSVEETNNIAGNLTELDLLQARLQEAQNTYNNFMNTLGATDSKTIKAGLAISELTGKIREFVEEHKKMNFLQALGSSFSGLGQGIKKLFPSISGLLKRFNSLVKYRMLRSIIRGITQGFSEGVKNVYAYSKAVGTSFAPAMDEATAVMKQFKNSVGAAAAPLIQALVPVLHQVIDVVITVINYLNQMFALLNGQTSWTSAIYNASDAFDDAASSAGGAGKAVKDLLADWDELNIIQSESGGGGGGSGKKQEDYASMFEQVNEFEETVKRIFDFINEHMGGLPSLLKKLGALLLGWKFSKAFRGVLGALGKIVAGGALIEIGLELSFGSGFEAGRKGYFDELDLIGAIGGAIATAVGGSLITSAIGLGGGIGFAIGLTVAILITLDGYFAGQNDLIDEMKWGDIHKTAEEIREEVRKQFSFDFDATLDIVNAYFVNEEDARKKVDEAISKFEASFESAKIIVNADTSTSEEKIAAVTKAATDAQEAIIALQNLIDTNAEGLKFTFTNFSFTDEEGNDITDSLIDSITTSSGTLREYFTGIGKELADLMLEGEKSGWQSGEMEAALALMESQRRIFANAKMNEKELAFQTSVRAGLSGVDDRETAMERMNQQKESYNEYKETVKQLIQQQADDAIYLASLAQSAINEEMMKENPNLELIAGLQESYDSYSAQAKALLEKIANDDFDAELAASRRVMSEEWSKVIKLVYGEDFTGSIDELLTHPGRFLGDLFGVKSDTSAKWMINHMVETLGFDEAGKQLRQELSKQMSFGSEAKYEIMKWYYELGGSIADLLTPEQVQRVADDLISSTESYNIAFELFKAMTGLDDKAARAYMPWPEEYQDIFGPALENAQEGAKEAVENAEPVTATMHIDLQPEFDGIIGDINKAIEDGIYSSDEGIDILVKYGDDLYNKVFEYLGYHMDEAGNLLDKNGDLIASAIDGVVENAEPVEAEVPVEVIPEVSVDLSGITADVNEAIKDGVYSSDEALDILIKYGDDMYNKVFEALGYHTDDVGNIVDKNGNLIASAIEEEVKDAVESMDPVETSVKLHVDPEVELSRDAKFYLQMIENAVNSGKGMPEIEAASKQAFEMFGTSTFLEVQPYVTELIQMYKELEELKNKSESGGVLATTGGILGGVLAGANVVGGKTGKVSVSDDEVASGVKGTEMNTETMIAQLSTANALLQRILSKEFTATLKPTSSVGLGLLQGISAASNVTGGIG